MSDVAHVQHGGPSPSRAFRMTPEVADQAWQLWKVGMKVNAIAEELGWTEEQAHRAIYRFHSAYEIRHACDDLRENDERLVPVNIDKLVEAIARPGIDAKLVPLALYRGRQTLGRIHSLWNLAIAMMLAEANTIGDGCKLSARRDAAHVCGLHAPIQHTSLYSFMSRLRMNPEVTRNIPGLERFVEFICPTPFQLTPVPLETTDRRARAPWRKIIAPPKTRKIRIPTERPYHARSSSRPHHAEAMYPFVTSGAKARCDLLHLVHDVVPKNLPEHMRQDICQDLIVAVLSGEIGEATIRSEAARFVKQVFKMFPTKYGDLSLDAPPPWDPQGRRLIEMIEDGTSATSSSYTSNLNPDRLATKRSPGDVGGFHPHGDLCVHTHERDDDDLEEELERRAWA